TKRSDRPDEQRSTDQQREPAERGAGDEARRDVAQFHPVLAAGDPQAEEGSVHDQLRGNWREVASTVSCGALTASAIRPGSARRVWRRAGGGCGMTCCR